MCRVAALTVATLLIVTCKSPEPASRSKGTMPIDNGGGLCEFKGAWVDDAMREMTQISKTLDALANDENCGPMTRQAREQLNQQRQRMMTMDEDEDEDEGNSVISGLTRRQTQLPSEIQSLVGDADAAKRSSSQALQAFGNKTAEEAVRRGLEMRAGASVLVASNALTESTSLGAITPEGRLKGLLLNASDGVLASMNGILDEMARANRCMPGTSGAGAHVTELYGGIIRTIGAASRSDIGATTKVADTLTKALTMAVKSKFFDAQSSIDRSQNLMELGCLLRSISANYCVARDTRQLLADAVNGANSATQEWRNPQSPLHGFYLVERALPSVSNWLSQLIYPTVTELRSANYEQMRMAYVFEMSRIARSLRGMHRNGRRDVLQLLEGMPPEERSSTTNQRILKKRVYDLISDETKFILDNTYLRNQGIGAPSNGINTRNIRALPPLLRMDFQSWQPPLRLLGFGSNEIPERVRARPGFEPTLNQIFAWITSDDFRPALNVAGDQRLTQFDDPVKLLDSMGREIETIITNGMSAALSFYIERANIDYSTVLALFDSVGPDGRSPRSSMRDLRNYIVATAARYKDNRGWGVMADMAWELVRLFDETAADMDSLRASGIITSRRDELSKRLLTRFRMLEMYNTLVPNRVLEIVSFDYAQSVAAGNRRPIPSAQQLAVARTTIVQMLMDRLQTNPNETSTNIAMAQNINLTNLAAFQKALGPYLLSGIRSLQLMENGRSSDAAIRAETLNRAYVDSRTFSRLTDARVNRPWFDTILDWMELTPLRAGVKIMTRPELYPVPGFFSRDRNMPNTTTDDRYHSYRRLRTDLCMLTLALPDPMAFWEACRGANAVSFFDMDAKSDDVTSSMTLLYDIAIAKKRTAYERNGQRADAADTDGICLLNDARRREMIYWNRLQTNIMDDRAGNALRY